MNKDQEISRLSEEFVELLKKGNVSLRQINENPEELADHPDFDKAIDLLAALDDLVNEA